MIPHRRHHWLIEAMLDIVAVLVLLVLLVLQPGYVIRRIRGKR